MESLKQIDKYPSYFSYIFSWTFLIIILWMLLSKTIGNLWDLIFVPKIENALKGRRPVPVGLILFAEFIILSSVLYFLSRHLVRKERVEEEEKKNI